MDAGCDDERVLTACRQAGAGSEPWWLLDLLLRHEQPNNDPERVVN
jgi:hypothetical protein